MSAMRMRYLRKKDDGHVYVWTETLAKRTDMEEFTPPAVKAESAQQASDQVPEGSGSGNTDPVGAFTDKKLLQAWALEVHGIKLNGKFSLENMQAEAREAIAAAGQVSDSSHTNESE